MNFSEMKWTCLFSRISPRTISSLNAIAGWIPKSLDKDSLLVKYNFWPFLREQTKQNAQHVTAKRSSVYNYW